MGKPVTAAKNTQFGPSQFEYDYHMVVQNHLLGHSFHSLIMAAMIRGDTIARRQLSYAFPDVANDLRSRAHPEIPPGRPERGDQARPGARVPPGADKLFDGDPSVLADEVADAMSGLHRTWAPVVLAILRMRYPGIWDDIVTSAFNQDLMGDAPE